MSGFLRFMPKDIVNLVYRYVCSGSVLCEVLYRVQPYGMHNNNNGGALRRALDLGGLGDKYKTIYSTNCKISKKRRTSPKYLVWSRKASVFSDCVCQTLLLCQDMKAMWNVNFKDIHMMSIIDGNVYHTKYLGHKIMLVPFFRSDHCWQDLAVVFLRNRDACGSSVLSVPRTLYCNTMSSCKVLPI
jgi:hypothetical protein